MAERGAGRRATKTGIEYSESGSETRAGGRRERQFRAARRSRHSLPLARPLTMNAKGTRSKNMDKLIAAVQARECLWDKSYRGHRNRFKLERYWNEVASEVGTSSKYCRVNVRARLRRASGHIVFVCFAWSCALG